MDAPHTNNNNTFAISNRGLLLTCTTISILSFFGILFLVVVVSLVVSKAVKLAENYTKFKNEVQDKAQDFVESDNFKNFQDRLVEASQNALNSTRQTDVQRRSENEDPYNY